jgi:hypothetical protein
VLQRLALSPKGLTGRHDLANEWAPYSFGTGSTNSALLSASVRNG